MFVVLVGALFVTVMTLVNAARGQTADLGFEVQIALWLWFTVLFANFAEAMAEGRGKAQAASLRKARRDVQAKRLSSPHREAAHTLVPSAALRRGDVVLIDAGDTIPADGEVIDGIASVNRPPSPARVRRSSAKAEATAAP